MAHTHEYNHTGERNPFVKGCPVCEAMKAELEAQRAAYRAAVAAK